MSFLWQLLESYGSLLLLGTTCVLTAGCLAVALTRPPIQKQRLGELTMTSALLWLVLASVPLPRWSLGTAPAAPEPPPRHEPQADAPEAMAPPATLAAPLLPEAESLWDVAAGVARVDPVPPFDANENAIPLGAIFDEPAVTLASAPAALRDVETAPPELATGPAHLAPVLTRLYAAGVLAASAYLIVAHLVLFGIVWSASAPEPWLAELFARSAAPLPRLPRLLVSPRVRRPICFGWLRPTILLPASCADPTSSGPLRQVLLHELAHVRQGDAVGNLVFNLALPLFYFHPLYWWLRTRVRLSAELIADDWAAQRSTPRAYARDLITFAKDKGRFRPVPMAAGIAMFHSQSEFFRRLEMLLRRDVPLAHRAPVGWHLAAASLALSLVVASAAIVGVPAAHADSLVADDEKVQALIAERDALKAQVRALEAKLEALMKRMNSATEAEARAKEKAGQNLLQRRREFEAKLRADLANQQKALAEARAREESEKAKALDLRDEALQRVQEKLAELKLNEQKALAAHLETMKEKLNSAEFIKTLDDSVRKPIDAAMQQLEAQTKALEAQKSAILKQIRAEVDAEVRKAIEEAKRELRDAQKEIERARSGATKARKTAIGSALVPSQPTTPQAFKGNSTTVAPPPVAPPAVASVPSVSGRVAPVAAVAPATPAAPGLAVTPARTVEAPLTAAGRIAPTVNSAVVTRPAGNANESTQRWGSIGIVDLANSIADAQANRVRAKVKLDRLAQLRKSSSVDESAVVEAEAELKAAEKRLQLFEQIVNSEIHVVKRRLTSLESAAKSATNAEGREAALDRIAELESRIKTLSSLMDDQAKSMRDGTAR